MIGRTLFLAFAFALPAFAAESTPAPFPAEKAAKAAIVPDGFRVEVFAAEPDVVQPVSFCIDARGRVWVAEALNYGVWQATGKDRIVILEDTDGDGRADSRKVFYEGFNYVTGIEVGFGGVWVVSPPKLYFIPMHDGADRPAGEPQVVFDGFGYKESRHNLVNGFTWGPDGWLYGGHGRTSPSDVGAPGAPADQRIHCDGGVYRIHPTRRVFENFADGTTNPWGVDFDDFGQCFVSNCVNPHLFHMIQGGHYEPWRNRPSSLYAYERLPTIADHLHYPVGKGNAMRGENAQVLAMGGGHAHCGTMIYLADRFPPAFRNTVMLCNVHGRRVNHDILRRVGSGYTAGHGKDFLIAGDPWFMGVTLRTGPDGSVYVSDWSDTGECHTYKPHTANGRIYKISFGPAEKAAPVNLYKLSDAELVRLQLHRNDWFVRHARRILQERAAKPGWDGREVHAGLRTILDSDRDVPQRLRALWALRVTGGIDGGGLTALLDDRSEHVRAWAIQLLCEAPPTDADLLGKFARMAADDPSPVVRLYLASALQRLPPAQRRPIAEGLVAHAEDSADANLPLMYWYGIEPLVPADPAWAAKLAAGAKIPLVCRFLGRRLVDDAVAKGEKGDLSPLVAVLPGAAEAVQRDLLAGARESLRGRRSMKMPQGWAEAYAGLARSADAEIRGHAVTVALVFGDPQALADLRAAAQSPAVPTAERVRALEALVEKRVPDLAPVLHALLADAAVRRAALRGLAAFAHADTPKLVLGRYAELTSDEKQDAVATLSSRPEYALALLEAVERKVVPRGDISAYVARQLYSLASKPVTQRLVQVWGEVRETSAQRQEQIAKYKKMLTPGYLARADLENGRLVYAKTCKQCHMLFGDGGRIGPDLTGSNRANLDYVLTRIIDPSAQIGRDYRMSAIAMRDGRVITGMIVERTPGRITVQTATERILMSPEDVEQIKDSPQSMMPEGQFDGMTREQIRDLIAYLAGTIPAPPPAGAPGGK